MVFLLRLQRASKAPPPRLGEVKELLEIFFLSAIKVRWKLGSGIRRILVYLGPHISVSFLEGKNYILLCYFLTLFYFSRQYLTLA